MASTLEKPVDIRRKGPDELLPTKVSLLVGIIIVGLMFLGLTAYNLYPIFTAPADQPEKKEAIKLPATPEAVKYWRGQATQADGRYKPFETACHDLMRQITSRNNWERKDAVAVILNWRFENDPRVVDPVSQWDEVPFIICQLKPLRKLIYTLQADGTQMSIEELHEKVRQQHPQESEENAAFVESTVHSMLDGKFVAPNDVKAFMPIAKNLEKTNDEVFRNLFPKAVEGEYRSLLYRYNMYLSIRNSSDTQYPDPLSFVALDQVPQTPWLSIGELRSIKANPDNWNKIIKGRVKDFPQLYIKPEQKEALKEFQNRVRAGKGKEIIAELEPVLDARRDAFIEEYMNLLAKDDRINATKMLSELILTWPLNPSATTKEGGLSRDQQRLKQHLTKITTSDDPNMVTAIDKYVQRPESSLLAAILFNGKNSGEDLRQAISALISERDSSLLRDLSSRLPEPNKYVAEDPKFRMLHMTYLETRFPTIYMEAAEWQKAPMEQINNLLAKYDAIGEAYRADPTDDEKVLEKSEEFFAYVKEVSEERTDLVYPGEDTIIDRLGDVLTGSFVHHPGPQLFELELLFNKVKPFMWSWVLMLFSLLFFCLSLGFNWRSLYVLGFTFFGISLCFQAFGFFTRVTISGRPPVANLYETVIWVAFMSGIFALILEGIYRRKVIAIAGALVATIGLVLADQVPLALDPKISPLTPVLRSGFWLTIHVLTIVSSYAGATLAWALGNISLIMIVFGTGSRDTIKMLSNFIYRALQIAVILLAIGTFLGGWWAAYSWGRFWGWDPKETGAFIALLVYVIPLHARYIGWIKDFGLAISSIVCYVAILFAWWGLNFFMPAGLHSYGFSSGGGDQWVFWCLLGNLLWVLIASYLYCDKLIEQRTVKPHLA